MSLQKLKTNLLEFGSDLLAIANMFANDLRIAPRASGPGFKTMFKSSFNKGKGVGNMFKSFKEDLDAIKSGKTRGETTGPGTSEERHSEAASPPESAQKPRAYYLDKLGLSEGAPQDSIKEAYRNLAIKYHPDKNKSSWAPQRWLDVQDAWDHLK
jgi:hypothetical protein